MADGRAYGLALVLLLKVALPMAGQSSSPSFQTIHGAIVRGDTSEKTISLVFTGDEYADGGVHIANILSDQQVRASFFFTGKFYRNPNFKSIINVLRIQDHYLGAHSDQHLLYCSWENRDSLLVSKDQFTVDLLNNYHSMLSFGISRDDAPYFLPPYEWYNDSIAKWTLDMGLQLLNLTHGTLSHADYTVPGTKAYRSSQTIYQSILEYETSAPNGLNGFILLSHIGTAPERKDKFYLYLEKLLEELKLRGYSFKRINEL